MESQKDYLHRRAEEEDAAADRASTEKAREIHEELATRYRGAVDNEVQTGGDEAANSTRPRDFRIIE